MQARKNLLCCLVPHFLNHRIRIGCGGVAIRRECRLRVAQLDAATTSDLRGGGQDSTVIGDVVGGRFRVVGSEGVPVVGVGTRIAGRTRQALGLEVDECVHSFDPAAAAIFHEAHPLKLPLVDRLAEIRSIHELVVSLVGKKLEQCVRHLASIGTGFWHDRNPCATAQAQLGGLRCVHGDCGARGEECRACQADQRKEGFFHRSKRGEETTANSNPYTSRFLRCSGSSCARWSRR